jgi:hypothetical protein
MMTRRFSCVATQSLARGRCSFHKAGHGADRSGCSGCPGKQTCSEPNEVGVQRPGAGPSARRPAHQLGSRRLPQTAELRRGEARAGGG